MVIEEVKYYFSAVRVERYLVATQHSTPRAIELYKINLRLCQAFHPLLSILEVVLRNRINDVLSAHFQDKDWIINQKDKFMSDPSLTFFHKRKRQLITNDYLKMEVIKAERKLRKSNTPVTSGKIITEQTLGFWNSLFDLNHYKLLKGKPIQIFKTLPPTYGRKEINDELETVRLIRNRIYHNEPICFTGNCMDFTKAMEAYASLNRLLDWIDPAVVNFIKDLDTVQELVIVAKSI